MKIKNIQRDIEESLIGVATANLPEELKGLRHLPVGDRNPEVSIRSIGKNRKVRADADDSYFDPDQCEVVIRFVPIDTIERDVDQRASSQPGTDGETEGVDYEMATSQLVDALAKAEGTRPFVGLKWFRDQVLPTCGHGWAADSRVSGALLRQATDQRLILTSQVTNPNPPHHPVTAIRLNRRHPRLLAKEQRSGTGFVPVRIAGGSIADTVLDDRR